MALQKKPTLWIVGVLAVVVIGVLLWAFAPWTLFVSKNVDEALPSASAVATTPASPGATSAPPQVGNVLLAQGEFRSYEHPTSGKATLLSTADGQTVVRLSNFQTSNGPDVRVWLSQYPAGQVSNANDGKYVDLGALKGNTGNQNYVVPQAAAGQRWGSVVIWCRRFAVPFGAASLVPEPPTPR